MESTEYVLIKETSSFKLYFKGVLILLLILALPLELIMSEALQNSEVEVLYIFQSSLLNPYLTTIANGLLVICRPTFLCLIGPILYHMINPRFGIKVIMVNSIVIYTQCLIKMIYCEPRPYWVIEKIAGLGCDRGYGSPSTQVVFAITGYVYILTNIEFKNRHVLKIVGTMIVLFINAMNIFIEIYLGDQFLHQILLSLCYGWIYLVVAISLDSYINKLVYKSGIDYSRSRSYLIYWFLITMGLFAISILIFNLITRNRIVQVNWISNAKNYCEITFDLGSSYTFIQTSFIFYNLGVISGSLFTHSRFGEYWYETGILKRMLRSVISICATCLIGYLFCNM